MGDPSTEKPRRRLTRSHAYPRPPSSPPLERFFQENVSQGTPSPAAQGVCEASPSFSFTLALSLSPHRHPFSIFSPGSRFIRFLFMSLSMCVFV